MLFQLGNFSLHSGESSIFKIDCDALSEADLECVAYLLSQRLAKFGKVEGVPTGGLRLAEHMKKYVTLGCPLLLIVDDVLTTGASWSKHKGDREAIGAVIFSRSRVPEVLVTPLFRLC